MTVLYGESGVGKSSLLRAGVLRELRAAAPDAPVVFHDVWSGPPPDLGALRDAAEAYLVLDQFEEYFLYHDEDDDRPGSLLHDLPELLRETGVNVLVALREDALARLDVFKARLPRIFANQVRLEHLDRAAARSAIVGPLERWNELAGEAVEIEAELVEAVLDDVATGRVEQPRAGRTPADRIEASYLQLVLERIWDVERATGSPVLRLETLRRIGGASTIVSDHVHGALDALPPGDQAVAASVLAILVTPSGTKIAHRSRDLAQYAGVTEPVVQRVLAAIGRERIVRSVDGSDRYEIVHDVLAAPVGDWRAGLALELERGAARRRQRRLLGLVAVSLLALAVVAGLAAWALSERTSARSQARHARARELEATALQQLALDPRASVRLGLEAARLEPGLTAETVLRQALVADRLRLVVPTGGAVRALAYSPDGRRIAVAAPHGRVVLVDATTGRRLRTLAARRSIATLGYSPDGTTLVAGMVGGGARAWDVRTGALVQASRHLLAVRDATGSLELVRSEGRLGSLAAHVVEARASGEVVAAVVSDPGGRHRAWLFDRAGRRLHVLPGSGIADLAFSPDGHVLATASADGSTVLWNPRTGRRLRVLRDTGSPVVAVAFSPDGTLLATAGQDSAVRVWTVATGARLFFFVGHTNPVTALAWSHDGGLLASASGDRTIRLWGVQAVAQTGSLVATLAGHADVVRSLAFSPDGSRLVSGSDDGTARIWDARAAQGLVPLGRVAGGFVAARWAGATTIVAGAADGSVRVYDARARRPPRTLQGPGGTLAALAVSPDGLRVAAAGSRGAAAWSLASGARVLERSGAATAVALGDGTTAVGGPDGTISLVSASGGSGPKTLHQRGAVTGLALSPDRILASASATGAVLWLARGPRALPAPGGVVRLAFSPRGTVLATADGDGTARLYDAATGRLLHVLRGHRAALTDLAFSADGALLATSSSDATAIVWDVSTGRVLHVLRGHFGTVASVGFSPDGRWVVTAGPTTAGLWPVSTGQLLFYLRGDTALLTSVSFSPDGRHVLSSSRDGTVRTYTCDVCGDLAGLEQLAGQRLERTSG